MALYSAESGDAIMGSAATLSLAGSLVHSYCFLWHACSQRNSMERMPGSMSWDRCGLNSTGTDAAAIFLHNSFTDPQP